MLTQRKSPYYQHNPKGILTAYAICPGCNNPIELIGMIRQPKDKRRYGKHCGYNVMGLAVNNVEDYHCCKYRAVTELCSYTAKECSLSFGHSNS